MKKPNEAYENSTVTGTLQEKERPVLYGPPHPRQHRQAAPEMGQHRLPVQGNQRRVKQLLDAKLVELQADDRRSRQAGWAVAEVGEVPFDEVVRRWMTRALQGGTLHLRGLRAYYRTPAAVFPQKLDLTMNEVSPTALESYCAFLLDAGLSANTVQHHLTLIRSVFNDEIRNGAHFKPRKVKSALKAKHSPWEPRCQWRSSALESLRPAPQRDPRTWTSIETG